MMQRPIAIVGMASMFPGSDGIEAFWQELLDGRDCVGTVPLERWDAALFAGNASGEPGRTYSSSAGMSDVADCYDAQFFGLDPEEVRCMDPQQGRVLELAWHACEDAGIAPETLVGQEGGVFVGVSTRDFDRRMANLWQHVNVHTSTGASGAIIANRLSYLLGLTGPSMVVDTACASSLTSVHLACMALENEECTLAFAGGVQLILSPANIIAFSQGGLLARDGRCKPFSAHADGYVCGEGAGLLLLKPLDLAMRDGDQIRAVIRGSAINHNGRSNGLSAPYRAGQQRVIRKALDRAGIAADSVGYVEAHAPGTSIGDAIEIQAIRDVYGANRPQGQPCLVGSVKSNIGHLEAAAGVAALIKAALVVERGMIPASLHCMPTSGLLKLDNDAVQICAITQNWPVNADHRLAGVSAFGFGGANAHIIVEQPPVHVSTACDIAIGPWVLAVSARSETAFAQLCEAYAEQLAALQRSGASLSALRDFCCATLVRRQHHALRRAFVISAWDDAIEALRTARPAQLALRRFRLGLMSSDPALDEGAALRDLTGGWRALATDVDAALQPGPPVMFALVAVLFRLGLKRIYIGETASSPILTAFATFARQIGLAVTADASASSSASDRLVVTETLGNENTLDDCLWHPFESLSVQSVELAVRLFERGFALRWQGFVALAECMPVRLPLYPFQRRRNHVIPDELVPNRLCATLL